MTHRECLTLTSMSVFLFAKMFLKRPFLLCTNKILFTRICKGMQPKRIETEVLCIAYSEVSKVWESFFKNQTVA